MSADTSQSPPPAPLDSSPSSPPPPAIEMRGCRRLLGRAGRELVEFALREFVVAPGERVALTGPSGCGKSTLLTLVSGLARPDAGDIRVLGTSLSGLSTSRLDAFRGRTMGFVHQSFNLLDAFTALENVLIGMRFGRAVPRRERRDRAAALLERVGLGRKLRVKPARLSVGERQRVALARALANGPAILLADEPTGSLDPATSESVFELLMEVCEEGNRALLFVTHDHDLADRFPRRFDCRGLVVHREPGAAAPSASVPSPGEGAAA